jgi:FkbM family methyltransferase
MMRIFKKLVKLAFGLDSQYGVKPLQKLTYIGSKYHGYTIPADLLNADSVCYCIGAGEDVSFDTELKRIFDARVFVFDPMPEGKDYFVRLKQAVAVGGSLPVEGDEEFRYRISPQKLDEIVYVEKGVWDKDTVLKFFAPTVDNYPSHSVYLFQGSGEYIDAPVDRLSHLMKKFNHRQVDLVKMEIEGAEYTVLDTIVKDKLDVKIICVEFDEVFHVQGIRYMFRIRKSRLQLKKAGFLLVHSTPLMKRTFVRKDVYEQLKARESRPAIAAGL